MTDRDRILELIHGDLDGSLSAAEKAELARAVLADPEARRLHEELRRTEALLRDLPQASPPDDLRSAVVRALRLPESHSGGGTVATGGVGFRLAAAVVAGMVVVGLGYGLLSARHDTTALQGSVAAGGPALMTLQAAGGEVVVRLSALDGGSRIATEWRGAATGEVAVRFDPARVTCRTDGTAWSSPSAGEWVLPLGGPEAAGSLDCEGQGAVSVESRSDGAVVDAASLALQP